MYTSTLSCYHVMIENHVIETETHIFTRVIEYDKNRTKDKKNNIVVIFLKVLVSIRDHETS